MLSRGRSAPRGATLFELLVATGILMSVLAIGMPSLAALRGPYALETASRQIAADLDTARQRAIARNVRYRVVFTGTTYVVERESAPNSFVADSGVQKLPRGATVGTVSPSNPIFDTRGMLAGNITVPIDVPGTGARTVTLNVLGRTTIS